ncbi:MAG: heavy metal translocating P-type ATPase metal-binding domain-containing protein [Puia sp.]|nr:heavy metal translocating P-type ATPase metal-binding domain-containing protein [Puia sp.]
MKTTIDQYIACSHCGEDCKTETIVLGDKTFCCEGCKMVYRLLDQNGLCEYYRLNERPGVNRLAEVRKDKFAFLDDEKIAGKLIAFRNEEQVQIRFYCPQIHCSSCLYLLEHLHQLHHGVLSSRVDFSAKEVFIVFDPSRLSLRGLAELLASTGYEPYISLHDLGTARPGVSRRSIYQLGIAGFCFANIMLLSFPEYLGLDASEKYLRTVFRYLNLFLSLPVLFYCAQPFYSSAWKSLRHKYLNIDAPIALAVFVTFIRSVYDVASGSGSGYFDSMTGIVFFMLAGRALQDRTYSRLSFERDYTSYFPIAVSVLTKEGPITRPLPEIRCGDTLLIHHEELIPADGILTRGQALIDYSFVTGESLPVIREIGEIVYAGGKQTGAAVEILVVKEVAQSYLTQLWERRGNVGKDAGAKTKPGPSFIDLLSRTFTYIVAVLAITSFLYWQIHDPSRAWNAATAVLIIACPCALLLSSSFTNGNILRILSRNQLYLRNAGVIDRIAATSHIVFDKTGTLTLGSQDPVYTGSPLTAGQEHAIATLAAQSTHPLSRALAGRMTTGEPCRILGFREVPGKGIEGFVDGHKIALGSRLFVTGKDTGPGQSASKVYVAWEGRVLGSFSFSNRYRPGLAGLVKTLRRDFRLSVLSGDNAWERDRLREIMGEDTILLFGQSPEEKAGTISLLQKRNKSVMMIGDGLNDAGALRQSDTGIALSENDSHFTPASDAILDATQLPLLPRFIRLCRADKQIILASFVLSAVYNVAGLFFAVQGNLSPLIAAILMPLSSLSILLITYGSSNLAARWLRL